MNKYFFVTDLHGHKDKYLKLFRHIEQKKPQVVLIGGDILPGNKLNKENFILDFLQLELEKLKRAMHIDYPKIFVILGNDDPKIAEQDMLELERTGLWKYLSERTVSHKTHQITGYSYIPPSPFLLKDWEKFDVSRHVDVGAVSPLHGYRSVPKQPIDIEYETIARDLQQLSENLDLSRTIFLFHAPPYKTNLDRAALDGKMIDHVPLDVHIGSIAIKNFIESRQPLLTLHGHVHESSRITGKWQQKLGKTFCFTAAYDDDSLAIVQFDPDRLDLAKRIII